MGRDVLMKYFDHITVLISLNAEALFLAAQLGTNFVPLVHSAQLPVVP
jgi:hypothetical protein